VWLHAQFEQLRPEGPSQVPDKHRLLLWQKPQPVAPVQPPHSLNDSQLPHLWLAPDCQAAHAWPLAGPSVDPGSHLLVEGHHPHPFVSAHDLHVACALHVGVGGVAWHWALLHFQSAQAPVAGPRNDPYAHPAATPGDPPHHPHPVAAAQSPHPPYCVQEVGSGGLGTVPSAGTTTGKLIMLLV